jgi:hypothetical protein
MATKQPSPSPQPNPAQTFPQLVKALADRAVSEGRTNWDGYFGHDNSYHLSELESWPEYEAVLKAFRGW